MSGKWIVTFKNDASEAEIAKAKADVENQGGRITNEYNMPGFRGFAAEMPEAAVQGLQSLQGGIVDTLEPDGIVTTQ